MIAVIKNRRSGNFFCQYSSNVQCTICLYCWCGTTLGTSVVARTGSNLAVALRVGLEQRDWVPSTVDSLVWSGPVEYRRYKGITHGILSSKARTEPLNSCNWEPICPLSHTSFAITLQQVFTTTGVKPLTVHYGTVSSVNTLAVLLIKEVYL